jgi:hypothetical protein
MKFGCKKLIWGQRHGEGEEEINTLPNLSLISSLNLN